MTNDCKIDQAINAAKEYILQLTDSAHSLWHTQAVVDNCNLLIKSYPEANREVVIIAAWWHDVGRLTNPKDHERISAKMAAKFCQKLGYSKSFCLQIYKAIEKHKWSQKPETLEGEIVRDADKLDFLSKDRWKIEIAQHNFDDLLEVLDLLPKMDDEILTLNESKAIYHQRANIFFHSLEKQLSAI